MVKKNKPARKEFVGSAEGISGRGQAEEAMRYSDEQFRLIVENSRDMIFTLNLEGEFIFVSLAVKEFLSYDPAELQGLPFQSIVHPDDVPACQASIRKNIEKGERTPGFEYRVRDKSGNWHWHVTSGSAVRDSHGSFLHFLGVAKDITNSKQVEDALKESEVRFQTLFENSPTSIWEEDFSGLKEHFDTLQANGVNDWRQYFNGHPEQVGLCAAMIKVVDVNQTSVRFFEVNRKEDIPTNLPAFFTSASMGVFKEELISLAEGKTLFECEIPIRTLSGGDKIVFLSLSVVPGYEQSLSRVLVSFIDITERKKAEESVLKSEGRFKSIIEHISDIFYILDSNYEILYISPQAEKALGFTLEEVRKNWRKSVTDNPINLAAHEKTQLAFTTGEKQAPYLQEFMHRDGTKRLIEINESPLKDDKGEVIGIIGAARDVTESKNAEAELRESEAQYRLLSEHMTDFIWLMDMNLVPTYQSPSAEKITGFTQQELMELPFEKRIAPGSLKAAAEIFLVELPRVEADADYNPLIRLELEYYRKDGTTAWSDNKFSIIRDPGGNAASILGEARDITERKQAEENLKRSEERFAAAFNINPDPTAMTVPETGKYVEVNPAFVKWSGYSREELVGRTSRELSFWISPADRDAFLDRLSTHGAVEDMEITFRVRSGELRDTWFTARNVYVAGERYLLTRAHDVTERNRILTALRESEEKYRIVVDNAREAIFVDAGGMFKFANGQATILTGYSQEELTSRPYAEFIHPDDRQLVAERGDQRLTELDDPGPYTFRAIVKSGETRWVELSAVPVTWEGKPAVLSFLTDVTERKHLDEERQRVAKLESVGLLAGGIAHDFNNILTSIMGNISLASMEAQDGSELQNSLQLAEKASQRAKDLTKQLLTFSKGGAPVTRLASLAELLKDTTGFALRGSNVKCHLSIPADLWHAEIDSGQISQVIQNLVLNAQQAMQSGGNIEVTAENMALDITQRIGGGLPIKEGNYVRIAVVDHGSGISAEHLDKIFDPFFTTKQTGSGLGLATSFSIARSHGGHLSVESELGSGSTFYLYLPASLETVTPKQAKTVASKPAGKARILVMDDEKGVRDIAGRMLNHIGYKDVEFAVDGAEAITLYKVAMESGKPFSVVILDLTISGGMGGKETAKKLLKIDPGVKAIVSSGYIDDSVITKFRDYGFSGMVAKPYTIEELRKAVQDVIG